MMPLTACAVILLALSQVGCQMTEVELNMAPLSFDDQYSGCEEKMAAKMTSTDLLEKELERNSIFNEAWEKAETEWKATKGDGTLPQLPAGFKEEHSIAVMVYTGSFYSQLNEAVRLTGLSNNTYMEHFHYKAFHYYLTRALQLLKKDSSSGCQTVYKGVQGVLFKPSLGIGKTVRFGQFTSASRESFMAELFGTDTFFTITTCLGADLAFLSNQNFEEEVLIPPYEVFNVTEFNQKDHTFVLKSTKRTCSNYNCAYLGGIPQYSEDGDDVGINHFCFSLCSSSAGNSSGPKAKVDTTYKYCSSSAPRGGRLLFSMISPELITGIFLMITAVTPTLVSGV
uniref:NAD(P)(+)--arginine ADP-ribosyltransferase n=1 Tax=Geotrypetes seraphini TaxID=260995 RepID=A0A6P8RM50_GEOSA|nr:ecto-ADP-ribosyltransferase 5-like isoform X4 [Geotrypetes seraphini]